MSTEQEKQTRNPSHRHYRVVIDLQHRLGGIDVPWSKPVKVIGRAWAGSPEEAAATVANRNIMNRIKVTIQKSDLI